jgi:hypothetical protein
MLARMFAALLLVAACSQGPHTQVTPPGGGSGSSTSPGPGPTEPPPGPGPGPGAGPGSGPAPAVEGPKLGEPCAPGDVCGEGSCVPYYGIAGPRGPQFKSCEIRCSAQTPCEGGRRCITVADGPGQVCR